MVNANSLITLAYFKEVMGITGSTNDTVYEHLINATADWLDRYVGRRLAYDSYSREIYDGTGANVLILRQYPVAVFTLLEHRSGYGTGAEWETVEGDVYEVDKTNGRVVVPGRFHNGNVNYRATYTAGYSDTEATAVDIPEDLKLAIAELVSSQFLSRGLNRNVKSETLKNFSVTYATKYLTDDLKEIFAPYRRIHV